MQPSEIYSLAWLNPSAPTPVNYASACIVMARAFEHAAQSNDDGDIRTRLIGTIFLGALDISMRIASTLSYGGGSFAIPLSDEAAPAIEGNPVLNSELITHAEALKFQMEARGFKVTLDVEPENRLIMFQWELSEQQIKDASLEAVAQFQARADIAMAEAAETTNKNL